jgi:hypothetical protein
MFARLRTRKKSIIIVLGESEPTTGTTPIKKAAITATRARSAN